MMQTDLLAFTADRAAHLSGLSRRTLRYWAEKKLIQPAVHRPVSEHRSVALYGYREMMSLLVVAELRGRHVSLQHVRGVVKVLRDSGYPEPLTELRFATVGSKLFLQHPDGSWVEGKVPEQQIIPEVLHLEPLRLMIAQAVRRDPAAAGRVEHRRGTLGSKAVFEGTRIPVAAVQRYLARGHSVERILDAYPDLTSEDVQLAARAVA